MDKMPDGLAHALAEYEEAEERSELIETRARQLAEQRSEDMLGDAKSANELLDTPGVDGDTHIARTMRNLDRARAGNQIALDAVLTAMTNLQTEMRAAAYRSVLDDCRAAARGA